MYHVILLLQRYVKEHAYQTIVVLSTHIQVLFVPSWKESTKEMQAFPVNHPRLHSWLHYKEMRTFPYLICFTLAALNLSFTTKSFWSCKSKKEKIQLASFDGGKVQSGSLSKMHFASWVHIVSFSNLDANPLQISSQTLVVDWHNVTFPDKSV